MTTATLTNMNIKHFKSLSQFNNLKEFNTSNEKWLADHKRIFTYSEYFAIKRLMRYAGNEVIGVANECIRTILKAIEKYDAQSVNGISRSTFKRAIKKAIEIGMITRYKGLRWNGSTTANVYVFQPYKVNCHDIEPSHKKQVEKKQPSENEVVARVEKEVEIVKGLNHLKASKNTKLINNNNKRLTSVLSNKEIENFLQVPFHEMTLADKVKSLVSSTVGLDKLKEINRVIFAKTKKTLKLATFKEHSSKVEQIVLDSLKTSLNAFKQQRTTNIFAYLNGVIENKLDSLFFELLNDVEIGIENEPVVATNANIYNWLLE